MRRYFLYSAYRCICLPEWNPGNGLWTAELIGRGVVAMIAAGQKSYFGVCMASPAAWILASALLIVMYYYVIHQNEKRFAKYADEE